MADVCNMDFKKTLEKNKLINAIHWKQNTLKDCEMRSIYAISIEY